ncbi:MAG: hypothetical protein U5K43_12100 [Halofilum sp. (in: g-proteobacteria)]|nr:hypothetical protein [Halofilum sp. (in: g-proteobacteria)]
MGEDRDQHEIDEHEGDGIVARAGRSRQCIVGSGRVHARRTGRVAACVRAGARPRGSSTPRERQARQRNGGGLTRRRFLQLAAARRGARRWRRCARRYGPVRRAIPASGQADPGHRARHLADLRRRPRRRGRAGAAARRAARVPRGWRPRRRLLADVRSLEAVVGRLAADLGVADELFMATKVWTRGREQGVAQMQRSRERMGGGRLELDPGAQPGGPAHPARDAETLARGGTRACIGVTHYTYRAHDELARIVAREPIDFVRTPLLHRPRAAPSGQAAAGWPPTAWRR